MENNILPSVVDDDIPAVNLHRDTLNMVGRQLERSKKLDKFLASVEDIIFSQKTIDNMVNDPIGLLNMYSKAFYYKNKADQSVIQIMEISNKNDVLKRFIASFMSEKIGNKHNTTVLNPESEAKVSKLVSKITNAGLNAVHGN